MASPTLVTLADEDEIVRRHITARANEEAPIEILEAGCGREWSIALPGVRYRLTGVDLDPHALEARRTIARDLEVAIAGDLRSLELPGSSFDVIVCAYVLEHVAGAVQVLENFARWLKPGGLLVLKVPDRDSAFGFVARRTPFWFHVAVWRYVYGSREAGRPGHAPYPTSYDEVLAAGAMDEFCRGRGLRVVRVLGHSGLDGPGLRRAFVVTCLKALALVSLGRLSGDHNNLTFLIEKPGA